MKPDYIAYIENVIKLKLSSPHLTSNKHQTIGCCLCKNTFIATPKAKVSNFKLSGLAGCPKCTHNARYSATDITNEARLKDMGYSILEPYNGLKAKILLVNNNCECGRSWKTTPERIFSGRSFCKPCNDDKKRTRFHDINAERAIIDDGSLKQYRALAISKTNKVYKDNITLINPDNLPRRLAGTDGGYHLDHIVSILNCFRNAVPVDLCASIENLKLVKWRDNVSKSAKPSKVIPPTLKKYFKSQNILHDMVKDFLDVQGISYAEHYQNDAGSFNFKIDDALIKICAFYDYSEQSLKSKKYLSRLRARAYAHNMKPMIIFEDEILIPVKFEIVKSRILNLLKVTPNKVFARKCDIITVNTTEKTKFLNENHIQGACGSTYNYGLTYNDKLVALMTFSKTREFLKKGKVNEYELLRYVTKANYNVVGGASKLLKHFRTQATPSKIISYCDLRWGDGKLYSDIGMTIVKTTDVNYWYIIDGKLKHRYGYRKSQLSSRCPEAFSPSKTEYAIMLDAGYDRVWDCGSKLFELT